MYDLSIYLASDRVKHISEIISTKDFISSKELESMADYILYGKDPDGSSSSDRKQIQIKPKKSTYSRKPNLSLDELQENPCFDERETQPIHRSIYNKPKPKIDRDLDSDIPDLVELWKIIDRMDAVIKWNEGKLTNPPPSAPSLTSYELYVWKHMLVELRQQQFTIKDSYKPTLGIHASPFGDVLAPKFIQWDDPSSPYAVAPMGIKYGNDRRFTDPASCAAANDVIIPANKKWILDFTNPTHVYHLLEFYGKLREECWESPDAPLRYLIDTLDWYIEQTNLSPSRQWILERKIDKATTETIREELHKKFGLVYSCNYISTIWKQEICGKIATTAWYVNEQFLDRFDYRCWKICPRCGKLKHISPKNFMRRSRNKDGFSNICKECM